MLFIVAMMSFFGKPGPSFATGGGGIDPEPSHLQSVIGGIIFTIMSLVCLFTKNNKE
jgi:hypothetical protein